LTFYIIWEVKASKSVRHKTLLGLEVPIIGQIDQYENNFSLKTIGEHVYILHDIEVVGKISWKDSKRVREALKQGNTLSIYKDEILNSPFVHIRVWLDRKKDIDLILHPLS
jgi:hypothetical protein